MENGRYVMRFAAEWGRQGPVARGLAPRAKVRVTRGERSSITCVLAGIALLLPLLIAGFRKAAFEARRWKESDYGHLLEGA